MVNARPLGGCRAARAQGRSEREPSTSPGTVFRRATRACGCRPLPVGAGWSVRLAVTTPLHPDQPEIEAALRAAERYGIPYVARGNRALSRALAEVGAEAALVLSAGRAVLSSGGAEHAWSPGMGALRLKRYLDERAGKREPTRPRAIPSSRRPESSPATRCWTAPPAWAPTRCWPPPRPGPAGGCWRWSPRRRWPPGPARGCAGFPAEAARRVEVRHADHAEFLARAGPGSFDVVVFDPMFRHARAEPGGFDVVRAAVRSPPALPRGAGRRPPRGAPLGGGEGRRAGMGSDQARAHAHAQRAGGAPVLREGGGGRVRSPRAASGPRGT